MPNKEFLEKYPLYRKFTPQKLPVTADLLPKVNIKMQCPVCKSEQTYNMTNNYWELLGHMNASIRGRTLRLVYQCAHCNVFSRYFFIIIGPEKEYIMKIGQFPPWEIKPDKNIEKMLGDHADLYKKGLICESQGYGIGAFSYYRRIVEEIIGQLLEEITDLLDGKEKTKYLAAVEETKKTKVAQDKIALVKDLLPSILRPEGMNPLSALHEILSKGLHAETDESCIEKAMAIREVLIFLAI